MKVYTKKGDNGTTQLLGGRIVDKFSSKIDAYGDIDELNAFIGHIYDQNINERHKKFLFFIQNQLFNLGSIVSNDGSKNKFKISVTQKEILKIEEEIDYLNDLLPELKNFILPSGHPISSLCHIARTICRRAERKVSYLTSQEALDNNCIIILNRLSDYLFMLARCILMEYNEPEIYWK